jgi:hypothetical protein
MGVILLVAGKTILGGALEYSINMACLACHIHMSAIQLESRQCMVKCRTFPTLGCVTLGAILPEAPLMRIVCCVAGRACLGSDLQVGDGARPSMARPTGGFCMPGL